MRELEKIDQNVREVLRELRLAVFWLTVVALVCVGVSTAFGEEPSYEVEISSVTCFTDHRFFDDWKTVTTATIYLDETKPFLNRHDLEVWSEGLRIDTFPASVESIDISGIEKPSFKLTDRLTLERRTLVKSPFLSVASCSFLPPPDGAAWIWSDETMAFELRIVRHVDDLPPWGPDVKWKTEVVEVTE